jgi:hypothetical protein
MRVLIPSSTAGIRGYKGVAVAVAVIIQETPNETRPFIKRYFLNTIAVVHVVPC